MVLDSSLTGVARGRKATLSYHNHTNYIHVMCPAVVEDAMVIQLAELEMKCTKKVRTPKVKMEIPEGCDLTAGALCFPPWETEGKGTAKSSVLKTEEEKFVKIERVEIPTDSIEYKESIGSVAMAVTTEMSNFPEQRDAILAVLQGSFGLAMTNVEAEEASM